MDPVAGLLGIDVDDPQEQLAAELVHNDRQLVAELVKRRRETMSQAEMGAALGIGQSAVSQFETGDRDPRLSTLRAYALALGVRVTHTVVGAEAPRSSVLEQFLAARDAAASECNFKPRARPHRDSANPRFLGLEVVYNGQSRRIAQPT